jgi:hypothetical protein
MKIAINTEHENKMPKFNSTHDRISWWRWFNGNFKNFDLPDVSILVEEIKSGHSYTAQHRGYRKADNFRCGQHIGLDFDTGNYASSFVGILQDEYIRNNAYLIHTTPSHREHSPRARVIFVLDRPIYNVRKYALLTEAFAETYKTNGEADPSCKDPVRIFFGATGCDVHIIGHTLTLETAAEIVIPYKETKRRKRAPVPKNGQVVILGDHDFLLENLVSKISSAPDGQKWKVLGRVSRAAGGYVGAGYFDYQTAMDQLYQAIAARPSTRDLDVAEERIRWGIDVGIQEPLYLEEDLDPFFAGMLS